MEMYAKILFYKDIDIKWSHMIRRRMIWDWIFNSNNVLIIFADNIWPQQELAGIKQELAGIMQDNISYYKYYLKNYIQNPNNLNIL